MRFNVVEHRYDLIHAVALTPKVVAWGLTVEQARATVSSLNTCVRSIRKLQMGIVYKLQAQTTIDTPIERNGRDAEDYQ